MTTELRVECAWCHRVLRDGPPAPVSHGICAACKAKLMFEWKNHGPSHRAIAGGGGGDASSLIPLSAGVRVAVDETR